MKLGNYNWCGFKCSCSAWVVPAFHVTKSKIDEPSIMLPTVHSNYDKHPEVVEAVQVEKKIDE
jgi:hypothetical protein